MNKVLYYSPSPDDNTAFYRSSGVLPYLSSTEYQLIDISHVKDFTWATFAGAKVLILQRPTEPIFEGIIALAKQMGLKVILDYDDDVLNVDQHNPTYIFHEQNKEVIKRIIESADELWVTTYAISTSFGFREKTIVIPNALNDFIFNQPKAYNKGSKIVVWRGSQTHEADVYEMADEIINMINTNLDWKFYFIGHQFTFLEQRCGDNYYRVNPMPVMDYFNFLNNLNPNIMIVPLCDTKINRGKSNISMIESSYAGAWCLTNKNLPEFKIAGVGSIFEWIGAKLTQQPTYLLSGGHSQTSHYVQQNLLLSTINELRDERILANL